MHKRVLVLPAAALILIALVVYKQTRGPVELPAAQVAVPLFSLLTPTNELVKLERYVGRHKILVVFFDGEAVAEILTPTADGESAFSEEAVQTRLQSGYGDLLRLREDAERLSDENVVIVAVSTALPQHNRKAVEILGEFPFEILSDPDYSVHEKWKRYDTVAQRPVAGVFVVNRAGLVRWREGGPIPEPNLESAYRRLSEGL